MEIVALDLETTGLDHNKDKIIEIALVKFDSDNFEILDKFSSFINPGIEIPSLIINITNINNSDIIDAPDFSLIKDKIISFIWNSPILWHNVYFDKAFLLENWINIDSNIFIDTFLLANFLILDSSSLSLEILSKRINTDILSFHRALDDTLNTISLFSYLIKLVFTKKDIDKEIIKYIFSKSDDLALHFINDIYLKNIKNIDKKIFIERFVSNFNLIKIANNKEKVDNKDFDYRQFLLSNCELEIRESQFNMMDSIFKAFSNKSKLVIEAATWIWKTFAYLIPSIIHSIRTWEQVFISTSTKALQDQIFYKDLEFLKNRLDFPFSFTKLKWKKNYIWIYSFINFFENKDILSRESSSFILKIFFWTSCSKYFELEELDFYWQEYSFLKYINSDDINIFSKNNIYSDIEPIIISRYNAKNANIVILNNSILIKDIKNDNKIFWKIKNLILDEAHNLEDVITNSLKKSINLLDIKESIFSLNKILKKSEFNLENIDTIFDQLIFSFWNLFDIFTFYINDLSFRNTWIKSILINKDFLSKNFSNFDIILREVKLNLILLLDELAILPDNVYLSLNREISYLQISLELIEVYSSLDYDDNYIRLVSIWYNNNILFEFTILSVGDYLYNNLWLNLDTCILTSASLRIWDSFWYISNMLKLDSFGFEYFETDFDYSKQSLLYIPDNLGYIKNNFSSIINFLRDLFIIIKWKTLVLFTSYSNIKELFSSLNLDLKKENINLYPQWILGGKNKLLDLFKQNSSNSILLGTDTFWEGVDISWDKLKYLIIHKVPFTVPSDPIFQARSSLYKDPFNDYALAKAILKLKQGFWRLIRTKTDTGIVIFLDDRILNNSWWKNLYKAFPNNINTKIWTTNSLLNILK